MVQGMHLTPPAPHHFGIDDPICPIAVKLQETPLYSPIPSPLHGARLLPCVYGVILYFTFFLNPQLL